MAYVDRFKVSSGMVWTHYFNNKIFICKKHVQVSKYDTYSYAPIVNTCSDPSSMSSNIFTLFSYLTAAHPPLN